MVGKTIYCYHLQYKVQIFPCLRYVCQQGASDHAKENQMQSYGYNLYSTIIANCYSDKADICKYMHYTCIYYTCTNNTLIIINTLGKAYK